MTVFLRQSTASQEIILGPFVDETDAVTAETGLTIANTDIKVWKHGGTSEASKNSGGATHIASGRYYAVLDATDTDTIGNLRASVHVAGALPVWLDCVVLDEAVYDWLFGTVAPLDAAGIRTAVGLASADLDTQIGTLATTDQLDAAIWAQTRFRFSLPEAVEAPESGSTVYRIGITTYNASGALAAPDDLPAVNAYYSDGTSANALVGTVTNEATGIYYFDLTIASSVTTPQYLRFVGTAAMSAVNIGISDYTWVVDDANPDFGTSDRNDLAAIKAKTDNLPSDPADQSAVEAAISALNDISVADILAGTADGVALSKINEMLIAFLCNEVSVSSAGGVSTYSYKKRDGSTVSFTSLASETNGTRATTGSLS